MKKKRVVEWSGIRDDVLGTLTLFHLLFSPPHVLFLTASFDVSLTGTPQVLTGVSYSSPFFDLKKVISITDWTTS